MGDTGPIKPTCRFKLSRLWALYSLRALDRAPPLVFFERRTWSITSFVLLLRAREFHLSLGIDWDLGKWKGEVV